MKTSIKVLLAVFCAALLVTASVLGTMAYLTSDDEVVNTFTVGNVAITLDEADVDEYGDVDGQTRVKANTYKLVPGHEYTKDPIVHFAANSEASYLFVKVVNDIADVEADTKTIDSQIKANGWTALDGVAGVYWMKVDAAGDTAVDYAVFETFTVDGDVANDVLAGYAGDDITVTAYAIQADTLADEAAAWAALNA